MPGLQGHESFGHFCASSTDLAAVTGLSSPAVEPIGGIGVGVSGDADVGVGGECWRCGNAEG